MLPGGRFQALAVIAAGGSAVAVEESDKVEQLRPTAQVVVEPPDGPVTRAFAVKGWPALCRLGEDGTIETADSQAVVAIPAAAHRAGQTSSLISHRLNTVRDANAIIVLSDGQVIEQCNHTSLI
jgi:hypothetical protein